MTPIITKYMVKNFVLAFLGVLFILLAITSLFDLIELLRRTASRPNVNMVAVFEMTLFKLPTMVNTILPFAILISSLFVFSRLTKSHELIIVRAAGVSAWQFIAPLLVVAFVIGVLNVTLLNPMAALSFKKFEKMEEMFHMSSSSPLNMSRNGLWLKETKDNLIYTIHSGSIKQIDGVLEMQDLSIFETDTKDRFKQRIEAEKGVLKNNELILSNAWIMEAEKPVVAKDNIKIPTMLSLDKIQDNFSSPETVSFWSIPTFIEFFENTGFSSLKHRLYWHSLIASPWFLCAMVLIASSFSLSLRQRQGRIFIKTTAALASGFILFFFSKFAYALGASSTIPLSLAIWSPIAIAISLCLFALLHYEDG